MPRDDVRYLSDRVSLAFGAKPKFWSKRRTGLVADARLVECMILIAVGCAASGVARKSRAHDHCDQNRD